MVDQGLCDKGIITTVRPYVWLAREVSLRVVSYLRSACVPLLAIEDTQQCGMCIDLEI